MRRPPLHHLAARACACAILLTLLPPAGGERHPHGGKVVPFAPGDPGIRLGADALRILQAGHPYRTQVQAGAAGGRGMVVQDVEAPPDVVWDRILDFAAYPKMVPKTVESEVYRREELKRGVQRIWVRMKVGFPVLKLQFYVVHLYDPSQRSMTWTLDYARKSDLDDSAGFWFVVPHPDRPNVASRVYYSVDVTMFPWVPAFVVDFMSRQALVDATAWVKKHSEAEAAKRRGGGGGSSSSPASPVQPSVWWRRRWRGWWWSGGERSDSAGTSAASGGNAAARQGPGMATEGGRGPSLAGAAAVVRDPRGAAGPKRYALVTTVLALLLYNVHLYFSQ